MTGRTFCALTFGTGSRSHPSNTSARSTSRNKHPPRIARGPDAPAKSGGVPPPGHLGLERCLSNGTRHGAGHNKKRGGTAPSLSEQPWTEREGGGARRAPARRSIANVRDRCDGVVVGIDSARRVGGSYSPDSPTAFGWTHSIDPGLARTLFSFTLHAIVYFWLLLAYIAYYTTLPRAAGGRLYSDTMGRIARSDAQERLPGLAGRPRQSPEDSGDSTFGNLDAEHCQLAVNLGCAPERVGGNHPFDQASNSTAVAGRPRWRRFTLDRRAQNLRNRSRCQRTTVSART
jgi:hypothetical protein